MTTTPRTDSEKESHPNGNCVSVNFARKLEAELNQAQQQAHNLIGIKAAEVYQVDCLIRQALGAPAGCSVETILDRVKELNRAEAEESHQELKHFKDSSDRKAAESSRLLVDNIQLRLQRDQAFNNTEKLLDAMRSLRSTLTDQAKV